MARDVPAGFALTLRNFLRDSGLSIPKDYRENGVSYIFTCPRCSKKDKLYVRKNDGEFVCFKCKEDVNPFRGRPEYALAEILGFDLSAVKHALYGVGQVKATPRIEVKLIDWFGEHDEVPADILEELPVVDWPWDFLPLDHEFAARGAKYLEGRGVPVEIAKQYDIRYCPEKRQVVFPVKFNDRLYGWQGRLVVPHEWVDEQGEKHEVPKSPSMWGLRREHLLMFYDRTSLVDHVVIFEGPVDALKGHLCGGNVATMGKGVSKQQIERIRRSGKRRVYVCLDPDAAEDTARLVRALEEDMDVYFMEIPNIKGKKMDAGAMTMEAVLELFRRAERVNSGRVFYFLH